MDLGHTDNVELDDADVVEEDSLINVILTKIKEDPITQSMYMNYIFYLSLLICVLLIAHYSKSSFFWAIVTIIFISAAGYFSHFISHHVNAGELFQKYEHLIPEIPYLRLFVQYFCKLIDFHDEIHHDTSINKEFSNVATEFALNFYVQAGAFMVVFYIIQQMNLYVIALWGFMYATIHNINYVLFPSNTHILHHVDKTTNYGIDIWDIIFNTKFDGDMSLNKLENINHYAINTIILTAIILVVMKLKVSINFGFD